MKKMNGVTDKEVKAHANQHFIKQKLMVSSREAKTKPFVYPAPIEEKERHLMHERIAVGAYFIWQNASDESRTDDFRNWLEAENMIFAAQQLTETT